MLKQFIDKIAEINYTYKDLEKEYSPEELERLYSVPQLAKYLPPKPSPISSVLPVIKKVKQFSTPVMNVLRYGYGNPAPPTRVREMLGQ